MPARALVAGRYDLAPDIDDALSAVTAPFELPPKAPFLIFALARTVGSIAHALQQAGEDRLIQPWARYVGSVPPARRRGG